MRETIDLLRSTWRTALVGALAGVLMGAGVAWTSTPVYASSSTVYLSAVEGGGEPGQAYQGSMLAEQKARSYAALFGGERLRSDAEKIVGVPVAPGDISAIAQAGTSLVTVEARAATPEAAVRVAEAADVAGADLVAELERPRDPLLSTVVTLRVVTPPSVPVQVAPEPLIDIAVGAVLGAGLGIAVGLLRRRLKPTVRRREDMPAVTASLPFLGTVAAPGRKAAVPAARGGPRGESVRLLRTALQHVSDASGMTSFLLTGTGSAALACDLAVGYCAAGRRVVLVDADLRNATVTRLVGWDRGPGLSDVLSGTWSLDDVVRPWAAGGVDVVSAGSPTSCPSELLDAPAMAEGLRTLSSRYQVVIVDSPAAGRFADPSVLATMCDRTLLVVRHGMSTPDEMEVAVEALARVPARIVGTVLSDVPVRGARGRRSEVRPPATGEERGPGDLLGNAVPVGAPDPSRSDPAPGGETLESVTAAEPGTCNSQNQHASAVDVGLLGADVEETVRIRRDPAQADR